MTDHNLLWEYYNLTNHSHTCITRHKSTWVHERLFPGPDHCTWIYCAWIVKVSTHFAFACMHRSMWLCVPVHKWVTTYAPSFHSGISFFSGLPVPITVEKTLGVNFNVAQLWPCDACIGFIHWYDVLLIRMLNTLRVALFSHLENVWVSLI